MKLKWSACISHVPQIHHGVCVKGCSGQNVFLVIAPVETSDGTAMTGHFAHERNGLSRVDVPQRQLLQTLQLAQKSQPHNVSNCQRSVENASNREEAGSNEGNFRKRTVEARMFGLRLHRTPDMSFPAFFGSRTLRKMSSFSSSRRTKNKPRLLQQRRKGPKQRPNGQS